MNKVLVIGKGKSGKSAKLLLEKIGYNVTIASTGELENKKDRFFKNLSFICVSPGVSIHHEMLNRARRAGVDIVSELELGFKYLSCKVIAVTGTNGKTTTSSLLGELCGEIKRTFVGGNIGVPVSSFCKDVKQEDLCVLEVSSFQAESFIDFKPSIGVFLNFQDDHLDRHGTRDEYLKAKLNMFKNQTKCDFAVLNFDDAELCRVSNNLKSKVLFFSTKTCVIGCYIKGGCIYFNNGAKKQKMFSMPKNIKEEHNKQNILAAITVAKILGIDNEIIKKVVSRFKPTKNRLETIATIGGVKFVNDSKSTNIASTLAAVKSYDEKILLIVGGSDKGYSFDQLFTFPKKNVEAVFVIGETTNKIIDAAEKCGYKKIYRATDLEDAVKMAYKKAKFGEVVLLSPACASFDMFTSYEQRGEEFRRIVKEIGYEICRDAGDKERKI